MRPQGCQNCDIAPTPYSLDNLVAPQFTGDETFFEALFAGGPVSFADLKAKADKGEALTPMAMPNVKVAVNIDNTYDVVYEQLSRNVVGMIEGSDPKLKDTYVMYGAHLDHIGYSMTGGGNPAESERLPAAQRRGRGRADQGRQDADEPARGGGGAAGGAGGGAAGAGAGGRGWRRCGGAERLARLEPERRVRPRGPGRGAGEHDAVRSARLHQQRRGRRRIGIDRRRWRVAKAFATGPKPKRSIVFMWHSGEEGGLLGSHYNADHPIVPLDKVQAHAQHGHGRPRRLQQHGRRLHEHRLPRRRRSHQHRLAQRHHRHEQDDDEAADAGLRDERSGNDPESVYTRSDHYSYAAKGIPIAFFTTGLHPDYHRVTDTVEKITFPKMARIGQLMYQTGFGIANTDKVLERDNKGPQSGFGTPMEPIKKK